MANNRSIERGIKEYMRKVVVIVQARMGSERLPGKVMKELCGKTVLAHDIERIKQARQVDEIIIATTINKKDDKIEEEALKNKVKIFRGSEEDVLSRYYYAAEENNCAETDIIIRITSDCPLFDSQLLDNMIEFYQSHQYDFVTNVSSDSSIRTFPRGLDTEIFSFSVLKNAWINAVKPYQREHVTPYLYENISSIYYFQNNINYSKYRWTLDTKEDWELILAIYKNLYHGKHDFYLKDIIILMEKYPELYEINKNIEQKKIKA